MKYDSDDLLLHVDLAGTALFALEGVWWQFMRNWIFSE